MPETLPGEALLDLPTFFSDMPWQHPYVNVKKQRTVCSLFLGSYTMSLLVKPFKKQTTFHACKPCRHISCCEIEHRTASQPYKAHMRLFVEKRCCFFSAAAAITALAAYFGENFLAETHSFYLSNHSIKSAYYALLAI